MRQGFWACSRGPASTGKRTAKQKGHCPRDTQGCPRRRGVRFPKRKRTSQKRQRAAEVEGRLCRLRLFILLIFGGYGERATSLHLSSRPQLSVAAFDQFGQLRPLRREDSKTFEEHRAAMFPTHKQPFIRSDASKRLCS